MSISKAYWLSSQQPAWCCRWYVTPNHLWIHHRREGQALPLNTFQVIGWIIYPHKSPGNFKQTFQMKGGSYWNLLKSGETRRAKNISIENNLQFLCSCAPFPFCEALTPAGTEVKLSRICITPTLWLLNVMLLVHGQPCRCHTLKNLDAAETDWVILTKTKDIYWNVAQVLNITDKVLICIFWWSKRQKTDNVNTFLHQILYVMLEADVMEKTIRLMSFAKTWLYFRPHLPHC